MIAAFILFMTVVVICGTIVTVCAMAMYHNRPSKAVLAKDDVEVAKAKTQLDMERWKQDWILDQQHKGERPALPPGTQTVEPPNYEREKSPYR